LNGSIAPSEETMARKRKRTPEEIAQEREWRVQSDANLRRLRELVDRGWAELEERRRREAAASS
jgi:hypothetical protein